VEVTAQDAFKLMLREHVAPVLREFGFKGSAGHYRREAAGYAIEVQFRKSRYSTRKTVEYWVEMTAMHVSTVQPFWQSSFGNLVPQWEHSRDWTIDAEGPVRHAAALVVWAFRAYAWLGLRAAVEAEEYVPGRPAIRARELPAGYQQSPYLNGWAYVREMTAAAMFPDKQRAIYDRPLHDPEERQALLAGLQHPDPSTRTFAATWLEPLAGAEHVRRALEEAAGDEEFSVRWAAHYALKRASYDAQESG
jgi:hypothetical protein